MVRVHVTRVAAVRKADAGIDIVRRDDARGAELIERQVKARALRVQAILIAVAGAADVLHGSAETEIACFAERTRERAGNGKVVAEVVTFPAVLDAEIRRTMRSRQRGLGFDLDEPAGSFAVVTGQQGLV